MIGRGIWMTFKLPGVWRMPLKPDRADWPSCLRDVADGVRSASAPSSLAASPVRLVRSG